MNTITTNDYDEFMPKKNEISKKHNGKKCWKTEEVRSEEIKNRRKINYASLMREVDDDMKSYGVEH